MPAGDNATVVSAVRDSEGLHVTFGFDVPTPAALFRRGHRFSRGHDPDHLTIDTDQTYLRHVDLVIHARTVP